MERKNTNLFFVSGILLLFALLFLGRSFKETDQTFLDNGRPNSSKPQMQKSTDQLLWIKNVSLKEEHSGVRK